MYDNLIHNERKSKKKIVVIASIVGIAGFGAGMGIMKLIDNGKDSGSTNSNPNPKIDPISSSVISPCTSTSCVTLSSSILNAINENADVCDDVVEAMCGNFFKEDPLKDGETDKYYYDLMIQKHLDATLDETINSLNCDDVATQFGGIESWKNIAGCAFQSCKTLSNGEHFDQAFNAFKHAISVRMPDILTFSKPLASTDALSNLRKLIAESTVKLNSFGNPLVSIQLNRLRSKRENGLLLTEGGLLTIGTTELAFSDAANDMRKANTPDYAQKRLLLNNLVKLFENFNTAMGFDQAEVISPETAAKRVYNLERALFKEARSDRLYLGKNIDPQDFSDHNPVEMKTITADLLDFDALILALHPHINEGSVDAHIQDKTIVTVHHEFFSKAAAILYALDSSSDDTKRIAEEDLRLTILARVLASNADAAGLMDVDCSRFFAPFPTAGDLNWIPSYMYVTKNKEDTDNRKVIVEKMIDNIIDSFVDRVGHLTWMSDATKEKAKEKARAVSRRVAYPDFFKDDDTFVSTLENDVYHATSTDISNFIHDSYLTTDLSLVQPGANWIAIRSFLQSRAASAYALKWGSAPNPDIWAMYPTTQNAYYEPSNNEIVFPIAIMQSPSVLPIHEEIDGLAGRLAKLIHSYGALGAVIGHELTHGFDNNGAQYDKDGNYVDWWVAEDKVNFKKMTQCLVDQYSTFRIPQIFDLIPDNHISGADTLGENIADAGGMKLSFNALIKEINSNTELVNYLFEAMNKAKEELNDADENTAASPKGINKFFPKGEPELLPGVRSSPQRLFLTAYAHSWCNSKSSDEWLRRIFNDVHAPSFHRIIGNYRNFEFSRQTFGCAPLVNDDGTLNEHAATFSPVGNEDQIRADILTVDQRKTNDLLRCDIW